MDDRLLFTLFGACAVGIVAYIREIVARRRDRAERVRDVQIALCAEIRAYLAVLKRDDLDSFEREMTTKMQGDFVPFVPTEDNNSLFNVIAPNVHVLPESSIDPVVVYYSQVAAIAAMAEDLRTEAFADMDAPRRIDMYRSFLALKREAIDLGEHALTMMQLHLKEGDLGVQAYQDAFERDERARKRAEVSDWLNSQASDRSGL